MDDIVPPSADQMMDSLKQTHAMLPKGIRRVARAKFAAHERYIANLLANAKLFELFEYRSRSQHDTLTEIMNMTLPDNVIIVYIPAIDQYGIFDVVNYTMLLQDYVLDNVGTALQAKQIIFTSDRQRMIMLYTDANAAEHVNVITKLARGYFKSDINIIQNSENELEITVNDTHVSNFEEASVRFREFIKSVFKTNPKECCNFRQPAVNPTESRDYIRKNITAGDIVSEHWLKY